MDVNRAKAIRDAANYLSTLKSGNGEFRHRFLKLVARDSLPATRSIIPVCPIQFPDKEVIARFAQRILPHKGRRILAEGVNAYVEYLWDSEGCPVFTDLEEDGAAAAAFLIQKGDPPALPYQLPTIPYSFSGTYEMASRNAHFPARQH
jgi:hypothetical protein